MQEIKRTDAFAVIPLSIIGFALSIVAGHHVVVHAAFKTVLRTFCTVTAPPSASKIRNANKDVEIEIENFKNEQNVTKTFANVALKRLLI